VPFPYAALLRLPGAAAFSAAAFVGRIPIAMVGIGSVLLVEDATGSYGLAGSTAAAVSVGSAAGAPWTARLVDRRGQRQVLLWCLLAFALGLLGLLLTVRQGGPGWLMLVCAAVFGGLAPQLGSCVRARWVLLLQSQAPQRLSSAFAWESVVDELIFVIGPALVTALAVLVSPVAGMLAALMLVATGTLAFVAQRATEPPAHADLIQAHPSAWRARGIPVLCGATAGLGLVFGAMEVVMVAFADERGAPEAAGILLPLIAVSSGAAGLVYGARTWRSPLDLRFIVALALLALGCVPLLLAPSIALMAAAAVVAGVAISPGLIASFALVEALVPPRARTEGFAWLGSALAIGVAAGSAIGGWLAEVAQARVGFLTCVAGAVLATLVALAGRSRLRPRALLATGPARRG